MTAGIVTRRRTILHTTAIIDYFNRADSTTTLGTADSGETWTAHAGTWGISNGKARMIGFTNQAIATVNGPSGNGFVAAHLVTAAGRADIGLVCRAADMSNYVLAAVTRDGVDNSVRLFKNVAGAFTQLGSSAMSGALTGNTIYLVKIVFAGTAIEVFVDGVSRISVTDSNALQSNTRRGLRSHASATGDDTNSRFDDFVSV